MKKTLLAAALLAGFAGVAQAETSVTLYGIIDTGLGYNKISGAANDAVNGSRFGMINGVQNGSRWGCLLYTSPSPRDQRGSRMPSSA